MEHSRAETIWVDVEDFLDYLVRFPRPSGIQRAAFEIMRALLAEAGPERVRFVRHIRDNDAPLYEVPWTTVEGAFNRNRQGARPTGREGVPAVRRSGVRYLIHSLPPGLRDPILNVRTWQLERRTARDRRLPPIATEQPAAIQPGDHFLSLAAPWSVGGFTETLTSLKHRHRLRTALLIHDLIPVRRPEWVGRGGAATFAAFLDDCLPLFDRLLSNSRHTAADVTAYARQRSLRLLDDVRPIPLGTSFAPGLGPEPGPQPAGLPQPGSYVLLVSTIEPRKNHELAIRMWRQLLDEAEDGRRDPDSIPYLVFAGRVGSFVGDLLAQLDACFWLDGRVRLIREPSDAELRRLYEGCLFTLVPSWFEGFGLPVSESLAMGKPCLASSATAIPEAGGALCRYFDPGDLPAAYGALCSLLDAPDDLAAWRGRIGREFRPTTWAQSAQATLACLDA